jgi:hypothetical protein
MKYTDYCQHSRLMISSRVLCHRVILCHEYDLIYSAAMNEKQTLCH